MIGSDFLARAPPTPSQYYMPWELLPSEDAKIKSQIEAAEASIQHETEQLELENAKEAAKPQAEQKPPSSESNVDHEQEPGDAKETVGSEANIVQETNGLPNDASTDKKPEHSYPEPEQAPTNHQDNSKDHDDDGDEMVEADEDMVIY